MSGEAMRWVVPDGWMPKGTADEIDSHEAICFVNLREEDADITLTFFFENVGEDVVAGLGCAARRTRHIRLDRPEELGRYSLPVETPYAMLIDSSVPIVAQHTRVDTRSPELALMTTMAMPLR